MVDSEKEFKILKLWEKKNDFNCFEKFSDCLWKQWTKIFGIDYTYLCAIGSIDKGTTNNMNFHG